MKIINSHMGIGRLPRFFQFVAMMSLFAVTSLAQGPRPSDIGKISESLGKAGVSWYTTWKSAQQEALRSNRPIFFYAAATQCSGISGVF